jgi:AhpD family alkylhydroperoxidase
MKKTDRDKLIRNARSLMDDESLTEALTEMIEEQRGDLGFLYRTLKARPRTFNPYILKGISVYKEPVALDQKTAELVATAAATALRCDHCIEAHIGRALQEGATLEEVKDVILIAAAISESSTLSVAFRKYKQQEGKVKRKKSRKDTSE